MPGDAARAPTQQQRRLYEPVWWYEGEREGVSTEVCECRSAAAVEKERQITRVKSSCE
jgi:hypothetical protein